MKAIKDFNKYIIDINAINKGMQIMFRFDNNYGISLVSNGFSYGNSSDEFEIAVIKFDGDNNFKICYSTDITDDVLGYQTKDDVIEVIEKVINLK